jgi:acyl-CoA dehydrogenase
MGFDDVFVPEENLLGELDGGFKLIMANFQWERLLMALGSVAGAQAAFERNAGVLGERQAFGRPIATFQSTRHKLAWCAVRIQAGAT